MDASPVKQTEARIHMPCFLLPVDVFQHLQLEIQQLLAQVHIIGLRVSKALDLIPQRISSASLYSRICCRLGQS